jgi:hypothetical protein
MSSLHQFPKILDVYHALVVWMTVDNVLPLHLDEVVQKVDLVTILVDNILEYHDVTTIIVHEVKG